MMDGIKEEIAGFYFNIEVTVESASNQVVAPGLEAKQLPQLQACSTQQLMSQVFVLLAKYLEMHHVHVVQGRSYKRCHGGAA